MKKIRIILAVFFGFALLVSFIQGFFLRFTLTLPFILAALAGLWLSLRWEVFVRFWLFLRGRLWGRIMTTITIILAAFAIIVCTVLSALMVHAITQSPPEGDTTVIVLGAQVVGERPSLILRLRLEAALGYLNENPDSPAVLSGGLGNTARISEAEAMRRWLVANGICDTRLFVEDQSTTTYENIAFSKIIIEENGLPTNLAVATDGFHMFRAFVLARDAGLEPGAVPSRTPFRTLPYYWLREMAAIVVGVVLR